MGNERIAKWDNIKFVLIVCVVTGHFLSKITGINLNAERLHLFIYLFHMPAFVFISGLFAKKTVDNRRYDKMFTYFLLFVVTKICLLISKLIAGGDLSIDFIGINDVSWYALALFVFCLLTVFLKRFNAGFVLGFAVFAACIAGYCKDIDTTLSASRIICFYPYFLAGYYLDAGRLAAFMKKKWVIIASWAVIAAAALIVFFKADDLYWLIEILRSKRGYTYLEHFSKYGAVLRLFWYVEASVMSFAVMTVIPSFKSFLSTVGSRSMQIYAIHYIPYRIFYSTLDGKKWLKGLGFSHYELIVVAIAVGVTLLLSIKPIETVMNFLVRPKLKSSEQ